MTVLSNIPENRNFLSQLNFEFKIKKAPSVNFFIQKINLPSIFVKSVDVGNPFVVAPYTGEHVTFGELNIVYKVDEDLINYLEIWNWIIAYGKPESFEQYKEIQNHPQYTGDGIYSDVSLLIQNNNKMINYEITFIDAFPIRLGDLTLNTVDLDVKYLTVEAAFKYTHYKITSL